MKDTENRNVFGIFCEKIKKVLEKVLTFVLLWCIIVVDYRKVLQKC